MSIKRFKKLVPGARKLNILAGFACGMTTEAEVIEYGSRAISRMNDLLPRIAAMKKAKGIRQYHPKRCRH